MGKRTQAIVFLEAGGLYTKKRARNIGEPVMALKMSRIAVIVSCFNRKATTLAGLESLFNQKHVEHLNITVFLVDDGSTDGTAAAVAERFPAVRILHGDGSLWWVGAMRKAFATAMAEGEDGYIWWNDDTLLMDDALSRLVDCAIAVEPELGPAIIVGTTRDPDTGERTFGGAHKRKSGFLIGFTPAYPDPDKPVRIDTMNGNFTLIPSAIANTVGNMEPKFLHRLADFDYGQRAVKAGFPVILAPGYFAWCKKNSLANTFKDGTIPLSARWKNLMSPRGSDPREWLLYTKRHYGWLWPLYFISPYVKVLFTGFSAGK
jgi:GT2 family glycosyltransferase